MSLLLLPLLLSAIAFSAASGASDERVATKLLRFNVQSENLINWGLWTRWSDCPSGSFVTAYEPWIFTAESSKLSKASSRKKRFHFPTTKFTGLEFVRAVCSRPVGRRCDPRASLDQSLAVIETGERDESAAADLLACQGGFYVSAKLKRVNYGIFQQVYNDDMGATDLSLGCPSQPEKLDSSQLGEWLEEQKCPTDSAICGMRSQVLMNATTDRVGINSMQFKCCKLPDIRGQE